MAKIQAKIWWRSVKVCNAFWVAPKARSVFRQLMLITFNCFLSALSGTVQLINVTHTQRGSEHKLITLNATEINLGTARTKQLKPGRKAMFAEEPQRQLTHIDTQIDTHTSPHLHTQTHICQDKSTCQRTFETGARRKWNCRSYCQKKSNNLNYVLQFVHPNLPTHTNIHSHPRCRPLSHSLSLFRFLYL